VRAGILDSEPHSRPYTQGRTYPLRETGTLRPVRVGIVPFDRMADEKTLLEHSLLTCLALSTIIPCGSEEKLECTGTGPAWRTSSGAKLIGRRGCQDREEGRESEGGEVVGC
jgi:hypothetical protein